MFLIRGNHTSDLYSEFHYTMNLLILLVNLVNKVKKIERIRAPIPSHTFLPLVMPLTSPERG